MGFLVSLKYCLFESSDWPGPNSGEPPTPIKKTFKISGYYLSLPLASFLCFRFMSAIIVVNELRGFLFFTYA